MNDLLLNEETGDLLIKNGDFVIGEADADIAQRILSAHPGEFKEMPTLGCNIRSQINGTPDPFWRGNTVSQLRSQGLEVKQLNIAATGVTIELN